MKSINEKMKQSAASTTELLFANFFIVRAPEKGNEAILLYANHYMNKVENLPLDGSNFKEYSQT